MDLDAAVDVDIDSHFGCLEEGSQSVQVLLNGIEAIMVLTLKTLTSFQVP